MQRRGKHASTTIEELCFLRGPCRGVILKITAVTVHLRDIEEYQLLEAVARERLLKT
jgi:hypothetical protein